MSLSDWSSSPAPQPTIIYPTAAQVADSLANIPEVIGGVTAVRSNVQGRVIVNVPAGTTTLTAWIAADTQTFVGFDYAMGVYVDGVYSSKILPATLPGLQSFAISLNGAAHVVEILTGFQNFLTGSYVWAVSGVGISLGTAATVTRRMSVYADSIGGGAAADPVSELGWFPRLRAVFPGALAQEGFGGRQLWDDCGSGSGQIGFANVGLLAARLVGLNFGVATRAIWLAIGINDVSEGHWDATTFGVNYAALLDAIHTADPTCPVYAQSMLITTTLEGTAPAFRTEIQTAATARPSFVTFVDGPSLMTTAGLSGDGLHPTTAGHATVFSAIRAVLGV